MTKFETVMGVSGIVVIMAFVYSMYYTSGILGIVASIVMLVSLALATHVFNMMIVKRELEEERKIMTDLTNVSTADLVRELEGRLVGEGGLEKFLELDSDDLWYFYPAGDSGNYSKILGPATILVVRGERE